MKACNGAGAKGLRCSAEATGQPVTGGARGRGKVRKPAFDLQGSPIRLVCSVQAACVSYFSLIKPARQLLVHTRKSTFAIV
jgi:hypothetical protein